MLDQISKIDIEAQVINIINSKINAIIAEVYPIPLSEVSLNNLANVTKTASPLNFPKKIKESHLEWVQTLEDKSVDKTKYENDAMEIYNTIAQYFSPIDKAVSNLILINKMGQLPHLTQSLFHIGKILEKLDDKLKDKSTIGGGVYFPLMLSIFAYGYLVDVIKRYRTIPLTDESIKQQYLQELCAVHDQLRLHLSTVISITTLYNSSPINMRRFADYPMEDIQKLCNKNKPEKLSDDAKQSIIDQVNQDIQEDYVEEGEEPKYTAEEIMAIEGSTEEMKLKLTIWESSAKANTEKGMKQIKSLREKIQKVEGERLLVGNVLLSMNNSPSAPLPYASAGQDKLFISPFSTGKGRKTRRAKLFPRTKLTHRSDRSKRLKTQSSRKYLKGKSKKMSRY